MNLKVSVCPFILKASLSYSDSSVCSFLHKNSSNTVHVDLSEGNTCQ